MAFDSSGNLYVIDTENEKFLTVNKASRHDELGWTQHRPR